MIVSIHQYKIACREQGTGDNFVRGRSAVQDEVRFVGIEYFGSEILGLLDGPLMTEHIAQLGRCVGHIHTENLRSQQLFETQPRRVHIKTLTSLMPWAGKSGTFP
ncbi:hypothetical protein D3C80_1255930 [compost metagenome]